MKQQRHTYILRHDDSASPALVRTLADRRSLAARAVLFGVTRAEARAALAEFAASYEFGVSAITVHTAREHARAVCECEILQPLSEMLDCAKRLVASTPLAREA